MKLINGELNLDLDNYCLSGKYGKLIRLQSAIICIDNAFHEANNGRVNYRNCFIIISMIPTKNDFLYNVEKLLSFQKIVLLL